MRLTGGRCNRHGLLPRVGITTVAGVQFPQLFLVLHPAILEPRFHLRLGQMQRGRELHSFGRAQVSLHLEPRLQTRQLLVAKHLKFSRDSIYIAFVRQTNVSRVSNDKLRNSVIPIWRIETTLRRVVPLAQTDENDQARGGAEEFVRYDESVLTVRAFRRRQCFRAANSPTPGTTPTPMPVLPKSGPRKKAAAAGGAAG